MTTLVGDIELVLRTKLSNGVAHESVIGVARHLTAEAHVVDASAGQPWRTFYDTGTRTVVAEIPGPVRLTMFAGGAPKAPKPKRRKRRARKGRR